MIFSRVVGLLHASGAGGAVLRTACYLSAFTTLYLAAIIVLHRGMSPLRMMAGLFGELLSAKRERQSEVLISADNTSGGLKLS